MKRLVLAPRLLKRCRTCRRQLSEPTTRAYLAFCGLRCMASKDRDQS